MVEKQCLLGFESKPFQQLASVPVEKVLHFCSKMNHCVHVLVIVALFSSGTIASDVAAMVKCVKPKGSVCVIKTLPSPARDNDPVQFPDLSKRSELRVLEGNLSKLSEAMIPMLTVRILRLEAIGLKSVFVGANFEELHLRGNKLSTIESSSTGAAEFALKVLDVRANVLTTASQLDRFPKLEELYLDDNQLTVLSMELFVEMSNLRVLSAAGNKLVSVSPPTGTLTLAELVTLSLARNQLSRLDMSNWQLPSLQTLLLANNTLVELEGLDGFERFYDLRRIELAGNNWSCGWLQRALGNVALQKSANDPAGLTVDADVRCSIEKVAGICCSFAPTSDTDTGDQLFLPEIGQVREAIAKLDQRHEQFLQFRSKKLADLTGALQKQVERLVHYQDKRESELDRAQKQAERVAEHVRMLDDRFERLRSATATADEVERKRKRLLHYMVDMKNKLIHQAIETDRVWGQANADRVDFELRRPVESQ